MIPDARHPAETYEPAPGAAMRPGAPRPGTGGGVPTGPALVGLAMVAAFGAALLLAGRGRRRADHPGDRLRRLAAGRTERRAVRREAKVRGFWAGVLASAGSAIASTLARRLAEDVLESARRGRPGEDAARG